MKLTDSHIRILASVPSTEAWNWRDDYVRDLEREGFVRIEHGRAKWSLTDKGRGWQPMEAYPDKGRRDESGKWVDEEGPQVHLLMEDGSVVTARWYGARTAGGGEAWAWWVDDSPHGIGLCEPKAWRALTYPVHLHRRAQADA